MPNGVGRAKVKKVLGAVNNLLKKTKLLSKLAPHAGKALGSLVGNPGMGESIGSAVGSSLEQSGYGIGSTMRKGARIAARLALNELKKSKYLSKNASRAGRHLGQIVGQADAGERLGSMAGEQLSQAGYGLNLAGRMSGMGRRKLHSSNSTVGTRAQVLHGSKTKTSGGLKATDLMLNKRGKIVSKRRHQLGLTQGLQRLIKAGYKTTKGKFSLFPKKSR